MEEAKLERALGANDLPFKTTTREVTVEKKVRTYDYVIDQDNGKDIIADFVRRKFNLDRSYDINVTLYDTERSEDLCNVVITQTLD